MKYFNSFPKILSKDAAGNSMVLTNLMIKSSIIQNIIKNPMLYYEYDIQEGDTPEIIANKYYGDVYRYWIVLFSNQIVDPQWDWPLTSKKFESYIESKYSANTAMLNSTVHHYEKVETFHNLEGTSQVIRTYLKELDYNNLVTSTQTFSFSSGAVELVTDKRIVSIYDYEDEINESKRTIRLLNASYVPQIESELSTLMSK
jgi:hypothetical protein